LIDTFNIRDAVLFFEKSLQGVLLRRCLHGGGVKEVFAELFSKSDRLSYVALIYPQALFHKRDRS
jgi:hypothetical protein